MKRAYLLLPLITIAAGWISGCSRVQPITTAQQEATFVPENPLPTDIWESLQERNPYPFTTPLPPPDATLIDGIYVKQEPMEPLRGHINCRRCPDWFYEGGLWRIRFDRGIYRVLYVDFGWKSLGSYTVSGDQLFLFNDPNCIEDTGIYRWKLESGVLTFEVVDDPCAIRLRGRNLVHLPWQRCEPQADVVASVQRPTPKGCE